MGRRVKNVATFASLMQPIGARVTNKVPLRSQRTFRVATRKFEAESALRALSVRHELHDLFRRFRWPDGPIRFSVAPLYRPAIVGEKHGAIAPVTHLQPRVRIVVEML